MSATGHASVAHSARRSLRPRRPLYSDARCVRIYSSRARGASDRSATRRRLIALSAVLIPLLGGLVWQRHAAIAPNSNVVNKHAHNEQAVTAPDVSDAPDVQASAAVVLSIKACLSTLYSQSNQYLREVCNCNSCLPVCASETCTGRVGCKC